MDKKVYYSADATPFIHEVGGVTLYFSSYYNMNRFKEMYDDRIDRFNQKLCSMYRCNGDFGLMLILNFYKICEGRFFKAVYLEKDLSKEYTINVSIE